MVKIVIEPVSRLEGEAKISIFLNKEGKVEDAYYQVVEFRGFEKFCVGRPAEEMPRITPRICGVCPWPHHIASVKAVDRLYGRTPTKTAETVREFAYLSHIIDSHSTHFYVLAAPDFVMGPDAEPPERNIIGMLRKNPELVKQVLKYRHLSVEIEKMIGGKPIHPVFGIPGGISHPITPEMQKQLKEKSEKLVEFAQFGLKLFEDIILKNKKYKDLIMGDVYRSETYYMGIVDDKDQINLYDGKIKVISPDGKEFAKFDPQDYLEHIAEHVEPWTYLKFPYLKKVGWKGRVDGPDSGVYRVNSLARLNVTDGMPTPLAQEAYEKFVEVMGKPSHATLGFHWARLIEILYAAERMVELVDKPEFTSDDIVSLEGKITGRGIGVIEAPRGTLIHHYESDENGYLTKVNLIVATVNNNAGMCISVRKAAENLIDGPEVKEPILNMIEMAFRAYDPCLACASHSLPGKMPMKISVYDADKNLVKEIRRYNK